VQLVPVAELTPVVNRIVDAVDNQLRQLAPGADIQHIGATAVRGALTKGDVDLVVRTSAHEFPAVVELLRERFDVKQPENWNSDFASFGVDDRFELPVGVQVVVTDSHSDVFASIRDYLRSNRQALADYNDLKRRHANDDLDGYWRAKDKFFERLLIVMRP
jgi:GrpB-like predicted nucleotidyltransferase (UPF0157 family)